MGRYSGCDSLDGTCLQGLCSCRTAWQRTYTRLESKIPFSYCSLSVPAFAVLGENVLHRYLYLTGLYFCHLAITATKWRGHGCLLSCMFSSNHVCIDLFPPRLNSHPCLVTVGPFSILSSLPHLVCFQKQCTFYDIKGFIPEQKFWCKSLWVSPFLVKAWCPRHRNLVVEMISMELQGCF